MNTFNYRLGLLVQIAELEEYIFQVRCLIKEKQEARAYSSTEELEQDVWLATKARFKIKGLRREVNALAA